MLKLIIICGFLYFFIRWIWRVLSPVIPTAQNSSQDPVKLKACEFCGSLVRVDKAVVVQGRLFCSQDHAKRMR